MSILNEFSKLLFTLESLTYYWVEEFKLNIFKSKELKVKDNHSILKAEDIQRFKIED